MKMLFLDESGDHNLSKIDSQYPLFVLGGIIVDQAYAEGEMTNQMNAFKQKVFGRNNIVLHTAEIVRNQNDFYQLKDRDFRAFFYQELNHLMRSLQYTVVACAIRKENHLSRYGVAALDPYLLSLDILVERFGFDVNYPHTGMIVAERRDDTLDQQLELAWLNLKIQGTRYLSAQQIKQRISGLNLRSKKDNIAGLQLADLVVSPIGRHVAGKPEKEDFRIIRQKFRRNYKGVYEGFGLVVLPK
ncbi:MAG: DUF3800 domain-containing protein [Alphaproteobacteria bacterium]|nr:DUF3800 domain-containing protein [Alphaproteobacteria bacterium]